MNQNRKKILDKIAIILTKRDHSRKELETKLFQKFEERSHIEWAIEEAYKLSWMKTSEELSQSVLKEMNRKNKGILFINAYLLKKGLPLVKIEEEIELEKAKKILSKKFQSFPLIEKQDISKAFRYLLNRGFQEQMIEKIIYDN